MTRQSRSRVRQKPVCCVCKVPLNWDGKKNTVCPNCRHDIKVQDLGRYVSHLRTECRTCRKQKDKAANCNHARFVVVAEGIGFSGKCVECGTTGPAKPTPPAARRAFERKVAKL